MNKAAAMATTLAAITDRPRMPNFPAAALATSGGHEHQALAYAYYS